MHENANSSLWIETCYHSNVLNSKEEWGVCIVSLTTSWATYFSSYIFGRGSFVKFLAVLEQSNCTYTFLAQHTAWWFLLGSLNAFQALAPQIYWVDLKYHVCRLAVKYDVRSCPIMNKNVGCSSVAGRPCYLRPIVSSFFSSSCVCRRLINNKRAN